MELGNKKICIVGTSGFARETLCCLIDCLAKTKYEIADVAVFMEADEYYSETEVLGIPVIKQSSFDSAAFNVVVAIGDPIQRKRVVNTLPVDTTYISLIHPSAVISQWVTVGEGSIITAGSIVTCNISMGKHAQLNLHTTIGHDCVIGDFFTTAPGANISGSCYFGDCVYFGTNASVRQGVNICDEVTIGMGGVVVKNIDEKGVYIGNPLKKLVR